MDTLEDFRKRIEQEQARFDQETQHQREAFAAAMEQNQREGEAASQESRTAFFEHAEGSRESFQQQQDAHQAKRRTLESQSTPLEKTAAESENELEPFKGRQRLLQDHSWE